MSELIHTLFCTQAIPIIMHLTNFHINKLILHLISKCIGYYTTGILIIKKFTSKNIKCNFTNELNYVEKCISNRKIPCVHVCV